ncbi:hypothetical protein CWI42_021570 [Ordospora colligata]|uniref:Uncharacterized protein n=1 Tax=Ordospora colligata OC4 TaxID=1354746 RepID=A0A0B2UM41_9MICR|nr:uncharacterized protein M896_021580 [Ordospora colligata OC4]KHN70319.1 hypothetical protein M896_021580 [Ordospora colligata OC4]TBU16863.1 hypothetical protein CWI41_021590 [Ordospora colligata]TBU16971.1 hypothetical protein CWI40_021590 [Ordospora colligata]TBU19412.1 hypothetical protein CWI42_021570 [Ordospora colligata]
MNINPRRPTKKYVFEPKVPQSQAEVEVQIEMPSKEATTNEEFSFKKQGWCVPSTIDASISDDKFVFKTHQAVLLSIPEDLQVSKIVLYEDGSCGLKVGDSVYPFLARFVGESVLIEHDDAAYNVGNAKIHLIPLIEDGIDTK